MRGAERLFQIIQLLRRSTLPMTGAALAAELEVSTRTVYRDVADLMAQRVPITGEAGHAGRPRAVTTEVYPASDAKAVSSVAEGLTLLCLFQLL